MIFLSLDSVLIIFYCEKEDDHYNFEVISLVFSKHFNVTKLFHSIQSLHVGYSNTQLYFRFRILGFSSLNNPFLIMKDEI